MTQNITLREGQHGIDGRDRFKIVCIDRGMVVIEYQSDHVRHELQQNRFQRRDGELRVV